jgi:fructose/tagatose bisphosphate aldolase
VLEDAPVMIQTDFINFNYSGIDEIYLIVRSMAESANAPILLHQDHPGEDRNIIRTLRRTYYSVMYDGGHLPLADNIRETRRFLEIAHAAGTNLESEIGLFGGEYQGGKPVYAGAGDAVLLAESGTDTLAVSVGSEHGRVSWLDLDLLSDIAAKTGIPLVLHGGSGIHPDDAKAATQTNVYGGAKLLLRRPQTRLIRSFATPAALSAGGIRTGPTGPQIFRPNHLRYNGARFLRSCRLH